ncbi:Homoserine/homoserine lactone efflux protein [Rhodoplanes serenus]|uniref:Homoserine/homoserine lactone efflux protein n=1 Tax=Rhodoplanes serenus TaxID=200615 RepID=A0A447D0M8_9BRAD|nr:LysE family translocator [Rhodoplanes serenus]VCU11111.1 Homoserine/homoserine lactone efflux protein [Rhodoplanes serenus]
MDPVSAIVAFSVAAALLTVTPGLDTALVLRTAAVEGGRPAMRAGAGIVTGVLIWGLVAALGLGAVLAVSEIAYRLLTLAGAGYLIWLGGGMLWRALRPPAAAVSAEAESDGEHGGRPGVSASAWFRRGLVTNLLNPKVGVFYVGLLPQFIPADMPVVAFGVGLAAIHAAMGLAWFVVLTSVTRPLAGLLRRPAAVRAIEGLTGSLLVAVGLRLALAPRG